MATPATSILLRVATILQDASAVRWTVGELVTWFNEGQRAIQVLRPDATSTTVAVELAAGHKQDLRSMTLNRQPAKLMHVSRNVAPTSRKRPVYLVPSSLLDTHTPLWREGAPSLDIRHYTFDPKQPTEFDVEPPAPPSSPNPAKVELTYSAYPQDLTQPTAGTAVTAVAGNLDMADAFATPMVDYIVYRAYSKDAEAAGNAARAQSHLTLFMSALGVEAQGTQAAQPQTK